MKMAMRQERTIDLANEQMLVLDGDRAARVQVLRGAAWLTDEGDAGDRVLQAGTEAALNCGRAVIEALGPARLRVAESGTPWRAGWQRLRRRAVTLRRRCQFGKTVANDLC